MLECFKEGMFWRGLIHDNSKLYPSEFFPYAEFFYGKNADKIALERQNNKGYYKPTDTGDAAFDFAWLLHQKRNRHHWQWWILPEDEGGIKVLLMHPTYIDEMMCDWIGASRAQGSKSSVKEWWETNNHKMQLNPAVKDYIIGRLKEPKFNMKRT